MRLRPLEELEGVGQYVDYRAETLDRAAGAAWKIEDERPAAGARERPREPAERIDPTHRLGESGGLSVEDRSGRFRGEVARRESRAAGGDKESGEAVTHLAKGAGDRLHTVGYHPSIVDDEAAGAQ